MGNIPSVAVCTHVGRKTMVPAPSVPAFLLNSLGLCCVAPKILWLQISFP